LKILRFSTPNVLWGRDGLACFKPIPELRYVEKLEVDESSYMLEKDGVQRYQYYCEHMSPPMRIIFGIN
jgi:hypothetical protein